MNKAELIKALAELFTEKMEIGEEPTNKEVIQALFPQIELVEIHNGRHRFFLKGKESSAFDLKAEVKWLNAPYQKGSKE